MVKSVSWDTVLGYTTSSIITTEGVPYYNRGCTAEMLLCQFPTLDPSSIHKAIVSYLDNRADVDRYIAQYGAELEHLRATGRHASDVVIT
jgi:hypothetical protein